VEKKKTCDTILDAIGNTPLVRLNRIPKGVVAATVYAKIETFNPAIPSRTAWR
jgi:cysteine synthase